TSVTRARAKCLPAAPGAARLEESNIRTPNSRYVHFKPASTLGVGVRGSILSALFELAPRQVATHTLQAAPPLRASAGLPPPAEGSHSMSRPTPRVPIG